LKNWLPNPDRLFRPKPPGVDAARDSLGYLNVFAETKPQVATPRVELPGN
jgi:hypothetical protein